MPNITPSNTGINDQQVTDAALLPNWRLVLANFLNGTQDARILFVGDSTTWGAYDSTYPSNPTQSSWPYLLSQLVNKRQGLNVSNASATPGNPFGSDSRVALTGAFAMSNTAGAGFGHYCWTANATGTLTYTPGDAVSYDRFDVYTQGGQGGGSLTATATGGSATPITQPYSNTVVKTTISATAGTSNNVAISWVSGNVQVIGIEAWSSTTKRIRFANAGVSGSTTSAWSDFHTSQTAITAWDADLTVIMLGINDGNSNFTANTYSNNMQTIINAAKAGGGDVVLVSPIPSDSIIPNTVSLESTYTAVCANLARSNQLLFCDLFNRFGGQCQYPLMQQTGTPVLHPNPAGYQDIARFFLSYLF